MDVPLFIWSIKAAEQSKYIDGIILSSNCEACLRICEEYLDKRESREGEGEFALFGWIKRPEEYCTGTSKNEEALIHTVEWLKEDKYDIIMNLQPTSPCRFDGLIDRCIEEYYNGGYDSLLTGHKTTPFLWRKIEGQWEYSVDSNDRCDRKMRQDFEEWEFLYHDCGSIYMTDTKILLDTECRIGYNPCVYETRGLESKQIDEKADFEFIQELLKVRGFESPIDDRRKHDDDKTKL